MTLYLFPNLLGAEADPALYLPAGMDQAMAEIDGLIAESEGGGRRFLKRFKTKKRAHEMPIALMQEKAEFLLRPVKAGGETWGVVSDAGLPCLADPGAKLVHNARRLNLPIKTFSGPSSITMALMLSGLPGQRFCFWGYISKEPKQRELELRMLETRAIEEKSTQIFIEAPYRNQHTLKSCLATLKPQTLLCVASELTLPDERIETTTIQLWRKIEPFLKKKPAIFLISCSQV